MPRLIDADDFVESLQKGMSVLEEEQTKYDDMRKAIIGMSISYIGATINSVAEMPTIDAVPVVHGEWTTKRTWEHDGELYCSVCGKSVDAYNDIRWADKMYNYCPNCGAKMDGGKDDAD